MNRFDVTVNSGLEPFAIKECQRKLKAIDNIENRDGHLYIRTDDPFESIMKLKSIDNVFVVLYDAQHPELATIDEDGLAGIFPEVLAKCDWQTGIRIWAQATEYYDGQPIDEAKQQQVLETELPVTDQAIYKPTFRCSCNRQGKHSFGSPRVASDFGALLNDHFHWQVDLTKFQLKVQLTIINTRLLVSIQLTREALFRRFIVDFGRTTLRGTIAYALLNIAEPRIGDIICDPLAGTGVIPIEAAYDWPDTVFSLGSDIHEKANEKSLANFRANPLPNLNFLEADVTRLPYRTGSIDCFVSDLPFGRRSGSKTQNQTLYPALLKEMLRCSRLQSGRIVFLTQDRRNANALFSPEVGLKQYFFVVKCMFVKVGGLESSIYHLRRNDKAFDESS